MKRLLVGLTLLLMAFLASLDQFDALHRLLARAYIQRWMTELVLAAVAVGVFAHTIELRRRMLFPRRGLALVLAGIVVYAVGAVVATGMLPKAVAMVPLEPHSALSRLPDVAAQLRALPFLVVAQVLLVVGAFLALTNLVPPDEFAEDF